LSFLWTTSRKELLYALDLHGAEESSGWLKSLRAEV
jgi:hypothetical protein